MTAVDMIKDQSPRTASVTVECRTPFDFELSLQAMRSFGMTAAQLAVARVGLTGAGTAPAKGASRADAAERHVLRRGVRMEDRPVLLEIYETGPKSPAPPAGGGRAPVMLTADARPAPASSSALRDLVARVVNAALDLGPFYEQAAGHPVLGPLTRSLSGMKAFRPSSLFDMLVIAVAEQQISLLAALRIQARLIARFGDEIEGEPVFPSPPALAAATLEDLAACGLSHRKAEYVSGLARQVVDGTFDLEALETAPDEEVRERIVALRGFGPWSAEYVLIRGLARPDAVPVDDLGIRTVVGKMLGDGSRPSAAEVTEMLAPVAPYRGLAAFYLLAGARLL